MKKVSLLLIAVVALLCASCMDIGDVYGKLEDLDSRLKKVESELSTTTQTANSVNTIVNQLKDKVYVESIDKTDDGYVINFTDGKHATIKNGADGTSPTIGVAKEGDDLVWVINGKTVKDADGNSVPASAKVPEFKFEENAWYYSFDGSNWINCGEKSGSECEIVEDEDGVFLKVGDTSIRLGSALESFTINGNKTRGLLVFVPTGKSLDLKEYITLVPEDALISSLKFESADPEAVSVSDNGIVKGLERGNVAISVSKRTDTETAPVKIYVRTDNLPAFEEPTKSEDVLFEGCNALDFFAKGADANRTREIITTDPKEGTGWYKSTTIKQAEMIVINKASAPVNAGISSFNRGHLSFWFYIEPREDGNNAEKLTKRNRINGGRVELSSIGGNKGIYWETKNVLKNLNDGWNLIDLKFKDAQIYGDDPNPLNLSKITWFRIYMNGPAALYDTFTYGIDNIVVYEDYEAPAADKKILLTPTFEQFQNLTIGGACNWNPFEQTFTAWVSESSVANALNFYFVPEETNSGATKENGHLHFKWYISDIAALAGSTAGQVELCSSGRADSQELSWNNSFISGCHSGWNDIILDFKDGSSTGGDIDLSKINWFRFYESSAGGNCVSMIKDVYVYAD